MISVFLAGYGLWKVVFQQMDNQGLRQLFLTESWELGTLYGVLVSL